MLIIASAIILAALVFSGLLLFRSADHADLVTQGHWYMKQGKAQKAVEAFSKLVHNYPASYQGHLELGKAYLAVDDQVDASKQFRLASQLRAGNLQESGAYVALARMMIAQGKYEDAQRQLAQSYKASKANRRDPELLSTLVDLYTDWGDHAADASPPDNETAFKKYVLALRYVRSDEQMKPLQAKLSQVAGQLAAEYQEKQQFTQATQVLETAARYQPDFDLDIQIANLYESRLDIDKAIEWNRRAYQLQPKKISLKLAALLIRKGKELQDTHESQKANDYFAEATQINETVRLPVEVMYPIKAQNISINYKVNADDYSLTPTVSFQLTNGGAYSLGFLAIRAIFTSGKDKLADAQKVVATAHAPLQPSSDPQGLPIYALEPAGAIPLDAVNNGDLVARIEISYSDAIDARWYPVATRSVKIQELVAGPKTRKSHRV